jgi:D-aspartate ligase
MTTLWVGTVLPDRRSVLLASASSSGTIAAARDLNGRGIEVGVLSSGPGSAAVWSNSARRRYRTPPETAGDQFVERLLAIGAKDPGWVLLPTSDETAWLYTAHADVLGRYFRLYQPSVSTIQTVLDKRLLAAAAQTAGIAVLPGWDPISVQHLERLAFELPYPILIKPRTHVHRLHNDKGVVARSSSELIQKYCEFIARERTRAAQNPLLPDAHLPLLQQFVATKADGVLSVTGFIDRTGEHFVTRHATKILQRSEPVGVGVCFESTTPIEGLSLAIHRLCRQLKYFGIFEVEFVRFNGAWCIIDFNPRLFNQVGMDIRRGMSLPLLATLDALGETEALAAAMNDALQDDEAGRIVFCDRFTLRAMLIALRITGRMSRKEIARWQAWLALNSPHLIDAAKDSSDRVPAIIHALSEIYLGLKSIPKFLRSRPRQRLKLSALRKAPL